MEIKDVENLAEMSKIELSEEEKAKILTDMDGILDYVKDESGKVTKSSYEAGIRRILLEREDIEFEIKNAIKKHLKIPFVSIQIVGSAKSGFSFVNRTLFTD